MYKFSFLAIFCLFAIGCFAPKLAPKLTPEMLKKQEEERVKAAAIYYHSQLLLDYPTLYLSYYDELTTKEFAAYTGHAKEMKNGIMVDYKNPKTGKTHCLAYYKDNTLKTLIDEASIYDDVQRLKIKKRYEGDNSTVTTFDSLQNIKSVAYYEGDFLKKYESYFTSGELSYLYEYSKVNEKLKTVKTAFRQNKTKKYIETRVEKGDSLRICFDETEKLIDCKNIIEKEMVEKKAEFPGGDKEILVYLAKNVKYPRIARENDIQGKVFIKFTVNANGDVEHVVPIRYPDVSLMQEAVRVVKTLPKFTPAEQDGKQVGMYYNLPVIFKLED